MILGKKKYCPFLFAQPFLWNHGQYIGNDEVDLPQFPLDNELIDAQEKLRSCKDE